MQVVFVLSVQSYPTLALIQPCQKGTCCIQAKGWRWGGFGGERGIISPYSIVSLWFHNGSPWTCASSFFLVQIGEKMAPVSPLPPDPSLPGFSLLPVAGSYLFGWYGPMVECGTAFSKCSCTYKMATNWMCSRTLFWCHKPLCQILLFLPGKQ